MIVIDGQESNMIGKFVFVIVLVCVSRLMLYNVNCLKIMLVTYLRKYLNGTLLMHFLVINMNNVNAQCGYSFVALHFHCMQLQQMVFLMFSSTLLHFEMQLSTFTFFQQFFIQYISMVYPVDMLILIFMQLWYIIQYNPSKSKAIESVATIS